jgi:uncharacterized membrane protein YjjP (DUF1212 family)
MTSDQRCNLVLAFARSLFINGQDTDQTLAAAERLSRMLGMPAKVTARWGELELQSTSGDVTLISQVAADPVGVDMHRVTLTMRALNDVECGRSAPDTAIATIEVISREPAVATWLFALAAGTGAVALSVMSGVDYYLPMVLIFASAGAGVILRRALAPLTSNRLIQPFAAAALSGLIGALAVRDDLSSSLRLVAACPCVVLAPGPHLLNRAMDLISGRIDLGVSRLVDASLIVLAISTGLLVGLMVLGVSLPVDPVGRAVPLWLDTVAAGVAVISYGIFFSMPFRTLSWPVAVGILAHAARWVALTTLGFGVASGALVACIIAGLILALVSRRSHVPFAAVGFAAVVSMLPGVYIFRMLSGLVQIAGDAQTPISVIEGTVFAGTTALIVMLAMSLGLIAPKMIIDYLINRSLQHELESELNVTTLAEKHREMESPFD